MRGAGVALLAVVTLAGASWPWLAAAAPLENAPVEALLDHLTDGVGGLVARTRAAEMRARELEASLAAAEAEIAAADTRTVEATQALLAEQARLETELARSAGALVEAEGRITELELLLDATRARLAQLSALIAGQPLAEPSAVARQTTLPSPAAAQALAALGAAHDGTVWRLVVPGDGLFRFGRAELESPPPPALAGLATILAGLPAQRVEIIGHSDAVGDPAFNLHLSEERARSVREHLRGLLPRGRHELLARGAGDASPIASNATPEGRRANRRVEILLGDMAGLAAVANPPDRG